MPSRLKMQSNGRWMLYELSAETVGEELDLFEFSSGCSVEVRINACWLSGRFESFHKAGGAVYYICFPDGSGFIPMTGTLARRPEK